MTQQCPVGEPSELLGLLEASVPGGGSSARPAPARDDVAA